MTEAEQPELPTRPKDETIDTVQAALAGAIAKATAAGEWGVVAQLAKELEARRLARAVNVVPFVANKRQRGA
jgi:hypothetical protein